METPNYRKASIYFDDETILEVTQRGGGGSGVGGETGLEAVNLITGESTNEAIAEQAETIEQQAATIETQAGTISDLEDEVAEKQAIIDAFPTIEALNVTANGTYSETGKAYSPVNVNVAGGLVLRPNPLPQTKVINNTPGNVRLSFIHIRDENGRIGITTTPFIGPNSNNTVGAPSYVYGRNNYYLGMLIEADTPITVPTPYPYVGYTGLVPTTIDNYSCILLPYYPGDEDASASTLTINVNTPT